MEQVLRNIGSSKTFSISRNPKKNFENEETFDTMRNEMIDEIPTTTAVKPEIINNKLAQMTTRSKSFHSEPQNFADFIANDRNIFIQRKLLLKQEKLQKQSIKHSLSANLNTKGLLQEDVDIDEKCPKEIDVSSWPQCKTPLYK